MSELSESLADLEEEKVLEITKERLESGEDPLEIVSGIREAAEDVGERFEKGSYFIADLMMMGEIMEQVLELLKPKLTKEISTKGEVVIGTVEGDIHNIGKDLTVSLLKANGFKVTDLGVDVPPEKFVEAIEDSQIGVVGMSGLLTNAFESMKETIEAIKEKGLREQVKIMIGGATVDEEIKEYVEADAYAEDAPTGVKLAKKWHKGGE